MRNLGLQEVIHHHKAVRRESQASRTEESNPRVHAFTLPSVLPLHTWASRHKGCLPDSMAPSTTLWRNSTLSKGPAGPSEISPASLLASPPPTLLWTTQLVALPGSFPFLATVWFLPSFETPTHTSSLNHHLLQMRFLAPWAGLCVLVLLLPSTLSMPL